MRSIRALLCLHPQLVGPSSGSRFGLQPAAALLVVALFGVAPGLGVAQQVTPGQRVRVAGPQFTPPGIVGTLYSVDADSLIVTSGGQRRTVPWSEIAGMEVSRGRRSYTLIGAVAGFVLSLGTIAIVYEATGTSNDCGYGACAVIAGGALLGGISVGAVVGGLIHSERWSEVDLSDPAVIRGAGLGLALHLRF